MSTTTATRTGPIPIQRPALSANASPGQAGTIPLHAVKATPTEGMRAMSVTPEERDVASALELLQRGQWDAGRAILQALATKHPSTPRYRALVSYALGRQAQVEQRLNEARIELDRALQLDPTLHVAKTALGELFSRRK